MKLSHGFRSRFEFEFAQYLAKNKIKYEYEKDKFRYILPIKNIKQNFFFFKIDFFLHLFGLCGEPHPSLIVGGFAGYFYYIIYKISNRRKK